MFLSSLALFAGLLAPAAPVPTAPVSVPSSPGNEQLLKSAHISATDAGLLQFFRKRTPDAAHEPAVAPLILQLTGKEPDAQARAAGELVALGPVAVKALRVVANNIEDAEAASRAQNCLQAIEGPAGAALVVAAAQLLANLKSADAAAVLLDYYPYADDESVSLELDGALARLALREGKPEPGLLRGLADNLAIRRHAAAVALCQGGGISVHEHIRPLLKDPKPTVRLQIALALADSHDAAAVPVLIELLNELPASHRHQAEEWLTHLAGEWALAVPQGNDATARRLRRDLWLAWWKSVDGEQLLDEFKARTLTEAEREQALNLIKKLDDESAEAREQASQELVALGGKVVPLLRQTAMRAEEARAAAFAQKCIELIDKGMPNPLPSAAPRLLALRRPPGTLQTLLAYLPYAENETVAGEIENLIAAVGSRDGKADPLLIAALQDKAAARRAAAGVVLARSAEQRSKAAELLRDADPQVRLRVGQTLAAQGQREAVPVLIALLSELPLSQAFELESYFSIMAGDKAPPSLPLTSELAGREKCRDAWAKWWTEQGGTVDLAQFNVQPRMLGLTLVVETFDAATRMGRVLELDAAGKPRWKLEGLAGPTDAQLLPGQRVLIAEQTGNRVTERDLAGKILWQKDGLITPFVAQRQPNGTTFIGCRNQLLEVDREGKQVFLLARPNEYLLAAVKLRGGQYALVNNQGLYARVDATGKELKSYHIPFNPNMGMNSVVILPNDHVLVSVQAMSKLQEFSPDGKTVWEATTVHAGTPERLPNGHTLAPNANMLRITELDRSGKIVSEMKDLPARPSRVSRR